MILIPEKRRYAHNEKRVTEHFAWLPKQMKSYRADTSGEWIWLEKYQETHRFDENSSIVPWDFLSRIRLSALFLKELHK